LRLRRTRAIIPQTITLPVDPHGPFPAHLDWLVNTGNTIASADGHAVELWELNHAGDEVVLSAWRSTSVSITVTMSACGARERMGLSHSEYLSQIKFPDVAAAPGPSVRSGDFAEIIVADYIEYNWILVPATAPL